MGRAKRCGGEYGTMMKHAKLHEQISVARSGLAMSISICSYIKEPGVGPFEISMLSNMGFIFLDGWL